MEKLPNTVPSSTLYIVVFVSCLLMNRSDVHGNNATYANHATGMTNSSPKHTTNMNLSFHINKDGGTVRQVQRQQNTQNSKNELRKRTMEENARLSLKKLVHIRSFPRPLKPHEIRAKSPFVRSRLSSLRSSTFKPIHIYGSVPFKTFLSALSQSSGQGNSASPDGRTYATPAFPRVSQEAINMQGGATQMGLMQDKTMVPRQYPVPDTVPQDAAENLPMFADGPGPMINPGSLHGIIPAYPENMPYFIEPEGYHVDRHTVHHHLHRKGM